MRSVYKRVPGKFGTYFTWACVAVGAALGLSACGVVGLGNGNDSTPSGTRVAGGTFGGSVSGQAQIYRQSNGTYTLQLISFSSPAAASLEAIVTGNGQTFATVSLISNTSTNKNYSFSGTNGASFSLVTIFSPSTNVTYGTAPLIGN